ncbi:MAG: 2Fe-2S iron-sulfur cluster binding domain-containing protein [Hyphomicrobiales bacterium]|nr:2Fe-2S iron-sulfur cluster binding domain-containing protein [Hyphomicrobiales bacterium]MDE2016222.1 2Fe-2S iron-sulfur cluster binding domain-containing protein [Hyphomicrobiales bacterium]
MHVFVVDRRGREHRLEAESGWRVMEVIRDWGIGIRAECGGACACATCHVYVDENWAARLPAPEADELDRLDEAPGVGPLSRLSCQILTSDALDGLRVTLAPGSEVEREPAESEAA